MDLLISQLHAITQRPKYTSGITKFIKSIFYSSVKFGKLNYLGHKGLSIKSNGIPWNLTPTSNSLEYHRIPRPGAKVRWISKSFKSPWKLPNWKVPQNAIWLGVTRYSMEFYWIPIPSENNSMAFFPFMTINHWPVNAFYKENEHFK